MGEAWPQDYARERRRRFYERRPPRVEIRLQTGPVMRAFDDDDDDDDALRRAEALRGRIIHPHREYYVDGATPSSSANDRFLTALRPSATTIRYTTAITSPITR